jgi:septum formation protein
MPSELILASGSRIRRQMLEDAGVAISIEVASIDEDAIRQSFRAEARAVESCAETLAELKAMRVSARRSGALVIGADQMLECDGVWFEKPADNAEARAQLVALRGRTHRLITACVVVRDGRRLWHVIDEARLRMRDFSDAFLEAYLAGQGASLAETVGGYRLEGPGIQLFDRVDGDFFTVLGLPLLPLLGFLRGHGVLER